MDATNLWGTRFIEGQVNEPRPGWNAELTRAAAEYRERSYARNEHGFLMRKEGAPENLLLALAEPLRTEFSAFLKRTFSLYVEAVWGGKLSTLSTPMFAASSAHTPNREAGLPHMDHGCNVVIAYFSDVHLEDEQHESSGAFLAFNPAFPTAYHMGGAEPMMFMHKPRIGSFVVYTPGTIHMHAPTFAETSRRCVIDTFVSFGVADRLPRSSSAIALP